MQLFVVLKVLGLVASVVGGSVTMHDPYLCYSTDTINFVAHLMGEANSYEAVRPFNFTTVEPYKPAGTASRFWYLGREAARTALSPSHENMIAFVNSSVRADIVSNYQAGRTTLCRSDFEAIRDFTLDADFGTLANAGMVHEVGKIVMRNIAKRWQQTFPNILTRHYSRDRFLFRHTSSARTNDTIRAITAALFGEAGSGNVIYENVPAVDWFLRGRDFCPEFSEEIADWANRRNTFVQEPDFQEMMEQINKKLGFHGSKQLGYDQIVAMSNLCRFQMAATFSSYGTGNSPWCAAFSVAHHVILEYWIDLGQSYLTGYGVRKQRLLENLTCGLMQDLLTHMQSNNNADKMARIFVSDSYAIQQILVSLGSFRDIWPLNQYNFAQETNRRWRLSMIAPLSENLVVVRYDCADRDHDLIFLLNEKPILIPGCDQRTGVCKLSVLVNRFRHFINANCSTLYCTNN